MKDKIQSYEEFERRLKSQSIPEIEDVATNAITRKKTPIFLRASFITIVLTVCISVSIAAAVNYTGWKFFDSEGNQVFEVRTMTEEEAEPHHTYDEIYRKYRPTMAEIQQDIPKGEFKYFLAVDGYEEIGKSALTSLYNGEEIKSVENLPTDIKEFLHLKNDLRDNNLVFTSGFIYYETPDTDEKIAEEMYEEAKKNNLKFIVKDGVLPSNISILDLRYENKSLEKGQSIQIIIRPGGEQMLTTENLAGYTQLTEDGADIVYGDHKIYFIKEDGSKKFLVSIFTSWREDDFDNEEEKEALIAIGKTILN
ncbi:hypothetical protein [Cytobacillus praedii]|uniref:hypothetical protein n=1 Tax=Cytobacillus praedii TaxID=1742358 RepID=UPI002E1AEFFD|nr:hypothetical protein [Cytobacillus praedii]